MCNPEGSPPFVALHMGGMHSVLVVSRMSSEANTFISGLGKAGSVVSG